MGKKWIFKSVNISISKFWLFGIGSNERYPEKKELIFEFQTEEDAFSKFVDIIESGEWFFNERKRIDWENSKLYI